MSIRPQMTSEAKRLIAHSKMLEEINDSPVKFGKLPYACFKYEDCEMRDHTTCFECKYNLLNGVPISQEDASIVYIH